MAPQKAYPRSVMKRIVKAHSDRGLSKNVDVLIYLDYALFLQESAFLFSTLFQQLRLTYLIDSSVNPQSKHKPSLLPTAPIYQQRTRNSASRPGTSERFPRFVVLHIRPRYVAFRQLTAHIGHVAEIQRLSVFSLLSCSRWVF